MATLDTNDANIYDTETVNLRTVIYPIVAVIILVLGGFGYYYYQLDQQDKLETSARAAILQAKTPEALLKVADDFPRTDQATLAVLAAAQKSLDTLNYDAATKDYQRALTLSGKTPLLHDAAQLGLGFSLEATGKAEDAAHAYLEVARQGDKSPYAPYAYHAAAAIYEQKGDKDNERKILTEASSLNPDSQFVKEAQARLKQMSASAEMPSPAPVGSVPAPAPASAK